MGVVTRRTLLSAGIAACPGACAAQSSASKNPRAIRVRVNVLLDQGVNEAKGLSESQRARFLELQTVAAGEYSTSGILFDVTYTPGAFVRTQSDTQIPERFLKLDAINLFVTASLGAIDRERTGGLSIGPRPRYGTTPADPFYKTFVGLREAKLTTLPHEYAHHLMLDTAKSATLHGNVWSDLRNDYYLWRQRQGVAIPEFRGCVGAPWAVR